MVPTLLIYVIFKWREMLIYSYNLLHYCQQLFMVPFIVWFIDVSGAWLKLDIVCIFIFVAEVLYQPVNC